MSKTIVSALSFAVLVASLASLAGCSTAGSMAGFPVARSFNGADTARMIGPPADADKQVGQASTASNEN